jgi:RNA recognition motif-containing protein
VPSTTRVIMFNIPFDVTEDDLIELFGGIGQRLKISIDDVKLIRKPKCSARLNTRTRTHAHTVRTRLTQSSDALTQGQVEQHGASICGAANGGRPDHPPGARRGDRARRSHPRHAPRPGLMLSSRRKHTRRWSETINNYLYGYIHWST